MILLSLASKQIWPQVLATAYLRPTRLFLLHSEDSAESRGPAQRLKRLFDQTETVPKGGSSLAPIPHDNFQAMEGAFDALVARHKLNLSHCRLNFTGGNKLMATAAFRWAAKRGVESFYLERGNRLTWFLPREGELETRSETVDGHITDHLDPVALLRCQLATSEVERKGQSLSLNSSGVNLPETDLLQRIQSGADARQWLQVQGEADRSPKAGDALEWATAAALLKLGVPRVQRSLRLKVRSADHVGTRRPHAEIDLLFTWNGRLWLVDCKDRIPSEDLLDHLEKQLGSIPSGAQPLLQRIRSELTIGPTKVMKEDLLAAREMGGLLGHVVCVRKAEPTDEVRQFARTNGMDIVAKRELAAGLRNLLHPERPAGATDLADLALQFSRPH